MMLMTPCAGHKQGWVKIGFSLFFSVGLWKKAHFFNPNLVGDLYIYIYKNLYSLFFSFIM